MPLAVIQPGVADAVGLGEKDDGMLLLAAVVVFGNQHVLLDQEGSDWHAALVRAFLGLRQGARHVFNVPVRHVAVSSEFSQSSAASTVPTVAPGGGAGRATITTGIDSARAAAILA